MLHAVSGTVFGWQYGAGHGYGGCNLRRLLLRCEGEELVSSDVASRQPEPAGDAVGYATDGGSGDEQGHGRHHADRLPGGGASLQCAELRDFGRARFAQHRAGQSREFEHHHHHQQWLQQRNQSVGFGHAFGDDGELQSGNDPCSRRGQFPHEGHGGREHAGGQLSHHGHRQWRRHPAEHHGHADGDIRGDLHACGVASFAQRPARESREFDHHGDHQRWFQQRDQSLRFGYAFGRNGELQSQPDSVTGLGRIDDDHCRVQKYADRDLSPHGYRQWRRDPAKYHSHPDCDCGAKLHHFGFASFSRHSARESGNVDDNHHPQRRLQQRDQSVRFWHAVGDDGELQSQPNSRAGFGQLDHDHHGGLEHSDGDLSHHGDRQRRRDPTERHSLADGDGRAELYDIRLAGSTQHLARHSRDIDYHYCRQ